MQSVYDKVLGEIATEKDKFDLGDIIKPHSNSGTHASQTRNEQGFEIEAPNSDKEFKGNNQGEFFEQEHTQEDEEFFKGMVSGASSDMPTDFTGQFKFEFEQKVEKVQDDFIIELPKEETGDFQQVIGDITPHKTILENNLISGYNSTISFNRTEKNSPGTRSPKFEWGADSGNFFSFPSSKDEIQQEGSYIQPSQEHDTSTDIIIKPPTPVKSEEIFNFPQEEPIRKRKKIFDDDEPAVIPPSKLDHSQDSWTFDQRPTQSLPTVYNPSSSSIDFNQNFVQKSFDIGKIHEPVHVGRPLDLVSDLESTPERRTGLNLFGFDLKPPPTDQTSQADDLGFSKFEQGWKKQKHNLIDNDDQIIIQNPVIRTNTHQDAVNHKSFYPQTNFQNIEAQQSPYLNPYLSTTNQSFRPPEMPFSHQTGIFLQPRTDHLQSHPPHPQSAGTSWSQSFEAPQRQLPVTSPLDNFDLLSLSIDPVIPPKPAFTASPKRILNPFDEPAEPSPPHHQPPITATHHQPPATTQQPPTPVAERRDDRDGRPPSLNDFRLLQHEVLTFKEHAGKSAMDLSGTLLLKAERGHAVDNGH